MEQVRQVVFRGATGPIGVPPLKRTESVATAVVPTGAVASRPYVIDAARPEVGFVPHKLFILPTDRRSPAAIYPIRGPHHELWEGFGGARNHQGADIGAACGTPLVSALPGKIEMNEYEPRAGNYTVIDVKGGRRRPHLHAHARALAAESGPARQRRPAGRQRRRHRQRLGLPSALRVLGSARRGWEGKLSTRCPSLNQWEAESGPPASSALEPA